MGGGGGVGERAGEVAAVQLAWSGPPRRRLEASYGVAGLGCDAPYRTTVSASGWRPLPERLGLVPPPGPPHEDLSPQLAAVVASWLRGNLHDWLVTRLALRLGLEVPQPSPGAAGPRPGHQVVEQLQGDPMALLTTADALLDLLTEPAGVVLRPTLPTPPDALEAYLRDGRSTYRVNDRGDGLERRVDPTAAAALAQAVGQAGDVRRESAATHLRNAWAAAHELRGRDPSKAYAEAIRAVEAAAVPVVLPTNDRATLGTVLAHLRGAADRWDLAMPDRNGDTDLGPLVDMLTLLWTRQTDRHGGNRPTRPIEQPAAEMAVQLAVLLVQWFSAGDVRRRS